ncbi:MAG: GvpL/GvpF family gas vesicle protein [Candidatus Delongbacteria bacterium]|nr:GvpL/GvpF family gas vesicle protein [Candidatus Delongbacteria bacterium]MCG2759648.1 GvpL/GvpF family gas vesicle protein [Candidatus Delongbacteria bacterium]
MAEKKTNNEGIYLYAVALDSQKQNYDLEGIENKPVYSITNGRISAVVSDLINKKIRPERRNIAAHQNVLKSLTNECGLLPVAFGTFVNNKEDIKKLLTRNHNSFLNQLIKLAGKVEMGLRVDWDVPNIFEYFVNTHSDLRIVRDQMFFNNREPSQDEKIEIGRIFNNLVNEDRKNHIDIVEEVLNPICDEIKINPPRNEKDVMRLACLIDKENITEFENYVFKAASNFDNNFAFDYSGPWLPYNFVDIKIEI